MDRTTTRPPIFTEVCSQVGITLSRFMIETSLANPHLTELESIFSSIATAGKTISNLVRRSTLTGLTGYLDEGTINVQGEAQKKLDVIANDVLKNALRFTGRMGVLASEEEDLPYEVEDDAGTRYEVLFERTEGKYVAVFDPLDGSSNVDAGIPTGTIFGIFEDTNAECRVNADGTIVDECLSATLQPGSNLVASGYILYSSATSMVFTIGSGTHAFTYDEHIGEFVLVNPSVQIPNRGKIYSANEANEPKWDPPLRSYLDTLKTSHSARYVGSMVADVHRTLCYGGIFMYPADTSNKHGKLRLLYEAAPMAFLVEQAGGCATTGRTRIMDIEPTNVHQRVPCILGSKDDVEDLIDSYEAFPTDDDIYHPF